MWRRSARGSPCTTRGWAGRHPSENTAGWSAPATVAAHSRHGPRVGAGSSWPLLTRRYRRLPIAADIYPGRRLRRHLRGWRTGGHFARLGEHVGDCALRGHRRGRRSLAYRATVTSRSALRQPREAVRLHAPRQLPDRGSRRHGPGARRVASTASSRAGGTRGPAGPPIAKPRLTLLSGGRRRAPLRRGRAAFSSRRVGGGTGAAVAERPLRGPGRSQCHARPRAAARL